MVHGLVQLRANPRGAEVAGLGSLSLCRGCAVSLFHGGACREAVTEALRHNSLLSSLPNVMDAVQMAGRGTHASRPAGTEMAT